MTQHEWESYMRQATEPRPSTTFPEALLMACAVCSVIGLALLLWVVL